ncbi:protein-L-isoaspartate O-methyltransferase family protein [Falsirhodobacter xinxiangensis]|uniref:protein-L-isoaspartate O-methyltransferase family protein n=1 Tax=Falsirhodobacter xinxiangensis TaxID=2530049 RepID=UPI0010AA3670|nr:protein-L-isoaspartate O-methyltransferase [Rhodobacter xinxiangensis]
MSEFAARRLMMVDTQVRPSDVTKYPIIEAMLTVPREVYVPSARREAAYVGENLELSRNRVILEARTLAKLLDAMDLRTGEVVLDVGCALGYSSAVLASMTDAVIAVEDEEFASEAERNLAAEGVDNAVVVAGPLAQGAAKQAPYDAIVIEGGVQQVPQALIDQLKEGGRIGAIFMDGALGTVRVGHKINGQMNWRFAFNASAPVLPGFAEVKSFAL